MLARNRHPGIERGFTITELLVGMVVSALVVAGAYRLLRGFTQSGLTQQTVADIQNEVLPLQNKLERDIRRASHGMPSISTTTDTGGRTVSFYAIEINKQNRGVSRLAVRGNFSGIRAQLRQDAAVADVYLNLQARTARGFKAKDLVLLEAGEASEIVTIVSSDTVLDRLRTGARRQDFPAGSSVAKITTADYKRAGAGKLVYCDDQSRCDTLTRNLDNLKVSLRTLDGGLDSLPPLDLARGQALKYEIVLRKPKTAAGRDSVSRSASGEITLRNLML